MVSKVMILMVQLLVIFGVKQKEFLFFGERESPIISFVAPNEFTTIVFSLQVTDNEGSTSTDFITVNVGNPSIYDIQFTEDVKRPRLLSFIICWSRININRYCYSC